LPGSTDRRILSEDAAGDRFPWGAHASSSAPAPRVAANPFAAPTAGAGPAGGGVGAGATGGGRKITLGDLRGALDRKGAKEVQSAQGMEQMVRRITSSAQHVRIYEDPGVQAQALAKIPVEDIKRKAREAPGDLGERDAVARHLLRFRV
jgi:hypothetical protein